MSHDCIFEFLPAAVLPKGMVAVRCRCHENTYATRFTIDPAHTCPTSGQTAPKEAPQ